MAEWVTTRDQINPDCCAICGTGVWMAGQRACRAPLCAGLTDIIVLLIEALKGTGDSKPVQAHTKLTITVLWPGPVWSITSSFRSV